MKFQLDMPVGTSIERTEEVIGQIEDYIKKDLLAGDGREEGIVNWSSYIGQGAPRFVLSFNPEMASPFHADMIFNITSYEAHYELIEKVSNFCTDHFPDLEFRITPMENGPPVGWPIQYRISGKEMDEIFAIVDKVKSRLAEIPGVRGISDDWGIRSKKLVVQIDQPRARRAGITSQDVAISLQTQLSGFQTTEYREEDEIIPVTMRSVAAERDDIGKLESMNVYAQMTGRAVPLKQLADLDLVWEPSSIFRRNRLKTVTVQADLAQGVTATEVNSEMLSWLDEEQKSWPVGYKYMLGGEAEGSDESQKAIGAKLPVAAFIILILLIIQFNSLRKAMIILSTIPLGLIGVVLGLLIMNQPFGFMTLLGIVSLAGIVINNAIVLLDRIKIEIEEHGLSPQRAVIESALRRLRPILLTTATTVGGMIPLYLGGGLMFQPMAVTIMFGLMGSTVLTLGVLPVLYSVFFRVNFSKFEY
jgi:multidrug efflux pump subunit AcrB